MKQNRWWEKGGTCSLPNDRPVKSGLISDDTRHDGGCIAIWTDAYGIYWGESSERCKWSSLNDRSRTSGAACGFADADGIPRDRST